jgi:transposase
MPTCPKCKKTTRQNRAGKTVAGSQRYECMYCGCKYTPAPRPRGYDIELRRRAVELYVDGMNLRRIARHLGVHHRSVSLWVNAHAKEIPPAPVPNDVEVAELDEVFTFIGNKKTKSTSLPK